MTLVKPLATQIDDVTHNQTVLDESQSILSKQRSGVNSHYEAYLIEQLMIQQRQLIETERLLETVQTKRHDEFDNSHANKGDSACLRTKHQVGQSNAFGQKLTRPIGLQDRIAVQKQRFDRSDKVRHQVSQINTHGQRLPRYDQLSEPKSNVVVSEGIKQLKYKSVQLHDDNSYQLNHTPRQNMLKPSIVTQQVHDICVVNECLRGDNMLFDQSKMPVLSPPDN